MHSSYALGLVFIVLVSVIWSIASILVQYLYEDLNFDSPFVLTYIGTSLFVILIPARLLWERRRRFPCSVFRCAAAVHRHFWMVRFQCSKLKLRLRRLLTSLLCRSDNSDVDHDRVASTNSNNMNDRDIHNGIHTRENRNEIRMTKEPEIIIPWRQSSIPCDESYSGTLTSAFDVTSRNDTVHHDKQNLKSNTNHTSSSLLSATSSSLIEAVITPNDSYETSSNPNFESESTSESEFMPLTQTLAIETPLFKANPEASPTASSSPQASQKLPILSHVEHIKIAAKIAPTWFFSNYFYNASLKYTSITSSTVLSSTGSLFTFIFAMMCGDESSSPSYYKVLGVLLGFAGSCLTSFNDAQTKNVGDYDYEGIFPNRDDYSQDQPQQQFIHDDQMNSNNEFQKQIWGDIAGLISAVGYGGYTVSIRILCPSDESRMSMSLLLGYIGLWNMVVLSPIAFVIFWDMLQTGNSNDGGSEVTDVNYGLDTSGQNQPHYQFDLEDPNNQTQQQRLTWFIFGCLVVKGLTDNVLSDYLWARAVILTSATVATVGLGLTIPFAFLSDAFIMERGNVWNVNSMIAATLVLFGFVLVNLGDDDINRNNIDAEGEDGEIDTYGNSVSCCFSKCFSWKGGHPSTSTDTADEEIVFEEDVSTTALSRSCWKGK